MEPVPGEREKVEFEGSAVTRPAEHPAANSSAGARTIDRLRKQRLRMITTLRTVYRLPPWRKGRAHSKSKCNKFREWIHKDSRSRAVGKWETFFVFHLFHGSHPSQTGLGQKASCCTWSLNPPCPILESLFDSRVGEH